MKYIAYCSDSNVFWNDALSDRQMGYRYPGTGWLSVLYETADQYGLGIASGDVALDNVANGIWAANDVLVIQEVLSTQSTRLLSLGATPFLLICFEAPLYAPFFYDRVSRLAQPFRYCCGYGFAGLTTGAGSGPQVIEFRFPSYYQSDIKYVDDWEGRQPLVLVAANKYKSRSIYWPTRATTRDILRQFKWLSWQVISKSYRRSLAWCLHQERIDAIDYFAHVHGLNLYGKDWDTLVGLPRQNARKLKANRGIHYQGVCVDKLEILSKNKFSLCFENIEEPGYVTEKIVDCFVAGNIPLYRGAPDIAALVPDSAYINMNKLDLEAASDRMSTLSSQDAIHILKAGREYLKSEQGQLHSYEGFAKHILNLAQTC